MSLYLRIQTRVRLVDYHTKVAERASSTNREGAMMCNHQATSIAHFFTEQGKTNSSITTSLCLFFAFRPARPLGAKADLRYQYSR
jgi:hypothetical protein